MITATLEGVRVLVIAFALAACGRPAPTGPAWPAERPHDPETDGGESLAPREAIKVATALEKSADAAAEAKPAAGAAAEAKPEAAKPEAAESSDEPSPDDPSFDDVFISEDIIIEIDDDD
jgi:hypothetical protein